MTLLTLLVLALVAVVVRLWIQQARAHDRLEEVESRLRALETKRRERLVAPETSASRPDTAPPPPSFEPELRPTPAIGVTVTDAPPPLRPAAVTPTLSAGVDLPPVIPSVARATADYAPETAQPPPMVPVSPPALPEETGINWERFLGVKLFAWIGGLALFLGIAFFIKYSFDRNLISPELRVTLGYLSGMGLVGASLWLARGRSPVTAQTLCGTGVLVLYASTFAAHAYYKFMGATPAFAIMSLVTAIAFILAVRLNAPVVAVLGLLGGFLTPPLLSTGVDNPLGLFGYLALLDIGLIAVALRQRWSYLVLLGAVATVLMQFGWVLQFFTAEKFGVARTIFLGFAALFIAGVAAARRWERSHSLIFAAAGLMPLSALLFAGYLLVGPAVSLVRPGPLFFSYILAADVLVLLAAWLRDDESPMSDALAATILLSAVATVGLQFGWVLQYFTAEKINVAMVVFLGFAAFFAVGLAAAHRWQRSHPLVSAAAIVMPMSALAFAAYLLGHPFPSIVERAPLFFTYLFLADVALLLTAWLRDELRLAHVLAGSTVFLLLSWWTTMHLSIDLLNIALAAYFLFAVLHAVFPVILQKVRPAPTPVWWANLYPPLALVMILVPAFKMAGDLSLAFWPVVLMIDVVAIALAVVTASLTAILAVFLLTALAAACWILQLPPTLPDLPGMLVVVGGFAVFFMLAAIVAGRKMFAPLDGSGDERSRTASPFPSAQLANVATLGAFMPFLLLTLMVLRLPLENPSAVFGLGAVLVLMLLGVVRKYRVDLLAGVALAAVLLLEYAWYAARFQPANYGIAMSWFTGFGLIFLAFPFAFQRHLQDRVLPWVIAALALPLHFHLIYQAFIRGVPDFDGPGLVPAVLFLPCFFGLVRLAGSLAKEDHQRLTLLALFGGATLFFVTLIFPIQFEKQWLTISWALEGAALLWLFHRLPHPGLRMVGVALLAVAFVRLALNPEVLTYAVRGDRPILNWYLYSYGLGAISLLFGAWLTQPPRNKLYEINLPPLLYGMGAGLLFLLLNIEIADYFTAPGQRLEFQFSGNFGRDMTYSLAWALFAFALLAVGFKIQSRAARYAGMGLLVVTLLKLFLHDLWQLGGLYRIGSLIGLAVVLILVSFIYQRFLSPIRSGDSPNPVSAPPPPPPPAG